MTEEKFVDGFITFVTSTYKTDTKWVNWMCEPENDDLYNKVARRTVTVEEALEHFRIHQSPLAKALR